MAGRYPGYDFPCCYFYVNSSNKVVYVGKANCTLPERIDAHSKEKKFNYENTPYTIYYQRFSNASDMDVAEKVYIKSLKPALNVADNTIGFFPSVSIDFSTMQIYDQTKQYQKVEKRQKRIDKNENIEKIETQPPSTLSFYEYKLNEAQQLLQWAISTKIEYIDSHTAKIILSIDDSSLSKNFYYDALLYLCFKKGDWEDECAAHVLGTKFTQDGAIILVHLLNYNMFKDCIDYFINRYKKQVKEWKEAIEKEQEIEQSKIEN